jgi:hypothetical protein
MDAAYFRPVVLLSNDTDAADWVNSYVTVQSFTNYTMPPNVALLTLRHWNCACDATLRTRL